MTTPFPIGTVDLLGALQRSIDAARLAEAPISERPMPWCERCDEPIREQYCTHRDLCEGCLHTCHDCRVEFAESLAYDDERDT